MLSSLVLSCYSSAALHRVAAGPPSKGTFNGLKFETHDQDNTDSSVSSTMEIIGLLFMHMGLAIYSIIIAKWREMIA